MIQIVMLRCGQIPRLNRAAQVLRPSPLRADSAGTVTALFDSGCYPRHCPHPATLSGASLPAAAVQPGLSFAALSLTLQQKWSHRHGS